MSEPARNRFALDLDDLERQLRGAAQPQKPGSGADPLMELTRLVGQDDPFKELFAEREPRPASPAAAPVRPAQVRPAPVQPAAWAAAGRAEPGLHPVAAPQPVTPPPAELRGALDEFEALLRRTEPARAESAASMRQEQAHDYDEPEHHHQPAQVEAVHAYVPEPARDLDEAGYHQQQAYEHPQPDYGHGPDETYDPAPAAMDAPVGRVHRRSRKGLLTATALVLVAVGGVGAAMMARNTGPAGDNGKPPVISADDSPVKVAPANPGGAEIPNQNKQIYERAGDAPVVGPADTTKVVSREEQPVDVQQATRSLAVRPGQTGGAITPTDTASASLAPTEPGLIPIPAVPGLGEPRRVRTVSIRPDGTPAGEGSNGSGIVTGSAPRTAQPAAAPAQPPRAQPAPVAAPPAAEPPAQDRTAAATTPTALPTPPARTRTAALSPQQPAAAPAAAAPRPDPSGGYAVQLAAPGSEAEARATFSALQRKYSEQLGSQSPIIRRTELAGGKTVYRLRVGPYSREDATSMCQSLQAAGGQCFIAKN